MMMIMMVWVGWMGNLTAASHVRSGQEQEQEQAQDGNHHA